MRRLIGGQHRSSRFAAALLTVAWCLSTASPAGASGSATVFPIPGSQYNTQREQIVFSSSLRIVGTTDFVSADGVGSILARCASFSPCHVRTTVSLGSTVIAQTGSEFLGAGELGYLSFTLTDAGRAAVAQSAKHGNQLGVQIALVDAKGHASGDIALVRAG